MAKHGQTETALFRSGQPLDQLKGIMKSQPQTNIFCMPTRDEIMSKVKVLKLLCVVMEWKQGHDPLTHFIQGCFLIPSFSHFLVMDYASTYLIHLKYYKDNFTGDNLSFYYVANQLHLTKMLVLANLHVSNLSLLSKVK